MKKNFTYVSAEKIQNVILASGVKVTEQAGFFKVGTNGNYLYIAKTKKVARIDIAGFSAEGLFATRKLSASEKKGAVEWGVDFANSEEDIVAGLELLLEHMKTLQPAVKRPRVSPMKPAKAKITVSDVSNGRDEDTKAAHLKYLQDVAAQYGTTVSTKTLVELGMSGAISVIDISDASQQINADVAEELDEVDESSSEEE